jgi:cytoskeleton protein RodZ
MLVYSQTHKSGVSVMTSIGERLRRQRIQNKISLDQVALDTKIGVRMLEAIEAEQFDKLPGGVFRRSFVLQYARALGLDPDEIAGELKQLNHFDEPPPIPTADMIPSREPSRGSGFPFGDLNAMQGSTIGSLLAAVGVIMVCALIYSWLQSPSQPAKVAQSPATQRAPAPPMIEEPAPLGDDAQAADQTPPPAETAVVSNAPVRVDLNAGEEVWISISSDGRNVFASALQPHETKVIEASEKVRILIGNAGGVEISLNGKPIGPIGPRGQIRVVELTPAGFQIVPRKSPASEL